MTEVPPSAASPMTLPSAPVLVATELHEPRPGLVPRARLVSRLVDGADRKLTLICAPAGWGKTVLLTQWQAAEAATRAFAWVQLDARDDDQVRLWSHVIGALRTVAPIAPNVGRESLAALPVAGLGLIDAVLAPLLNELAAHTRPIVLVLDDYHFVRDRRIHESVGYLLRHSPPNLRLAIATRVDPPLPLGSLRASGQLTEIRAAELGFTDIEAYTYGLPDPQRAFAEASLALGWGLDTPRVHAILGAAYNAFGQLEAAATHILRQIELVTTELVTTSALPAGGSLALDLVPGRRSPSLSSPGKRSPSRPAAGLPRVLGLNRRAARSRRLARRRRGR